MVVENNQVNLGSVSVTCKTLNINMMFDKAHVYGMIKQGDTYKKGKRIGTLDASNGLYKIDNNFFKYRFQLERICA